ncbi:MAG: hypothetical protein VX218_10940 [Pseudomonadota bacterium]|nr:hypothetical protein [Pseudomonadota bacterium]
MPRRRGGVNAVTPPANQSVARTSLGSPGPSRGQFDRLRLRRSDHCRRLPAPAQFD